MILLHWVQDLYYDFHPEAGILFASIPDFADYYKEEESNNQGIECMRLLNEIFGDFDQLLTDKRFQSIYSAQLRPGSGTDKINFIHCQHFM